MDAATFTEKLTQFAPLYKQYSPQVFAHLYQVHGDEATARQLCEDFFVRWWDQAENLEGIEADTLLKELWKEGKKAQTDHIPPFDLEDNWEALVLKIGTQAGLAPPTPRNSLGSWIMYGLIAAIMLAFAYWVGQKQQDIRLENETAQAQTYDLPAGIQAKLNPGSLLTYGQETQTPFEVDLKQGLATFSVPTDEPIWIHTPAGTLEGKKGAFTLELTDRLLAIKNQKAQLRLFPLEQQAKAQSIPPDQQIEIALP
ncbi:MAG: hypothetical protein AAFR61_03255 [Bacteroidota bacterium]